MKHQSLQTLIALLVLAVLVTGWIMLEKRDPSSPYFDVDAVHDSNLPGSSLFPGSLADNWFNNPARNTFGDVTITAKGNQVVVTLPVHAPLSDLNVVVNRQSVELSAILQQTTANGSMQASVSHAETLPFPVDATSLKVSEGSEQIVITLDKLP